MKKSGFKLVALSLVLSLVFVSACTSPKESGKTGGDSTTNASKSLYEVKIFSGANTAKLVQKSDQTPIGKIIKEKFNIVFEFIPFSDSYKEKTNLMLAGGDYPEIMRIEDQDILIKYIKAGAVIQLDSYIDKSKNFKEFFADAMPYWRLESGDGHIYNWNMGIPQDLIGFPEHNDIAVRIDTLKQQGWPTLVNTDDYIEFFKKALQDNPTTNGQKTVGLTAPFGEAWGIAGIGPIMYEKGGKYVQVANNATIWSPTEEKFVDMLKDPYTVESFKFFNKMYREGLLDPESFTDKQSQVEEKLNSGRALGVWYISGISWGANQKLRDAGNPELQYINLAVRTPTQFQLNEKRLKMTQITRPFDIGVITKNAKQPERLFELIDWAASEEGQMLLQSGIEGVHYNIVDGERAPSEAYKKGVLTDPDYATKEGFYLFGGILPRAAAASKDGLPYSLGSIPSFQDESMPEVLKDAYKNLGWTDSEQYWRETSVEAPVGLAQSIFMDPTTDMGRLEQKLIEVRVKNTPKLIMAKDDADFDRIYEEVLAEYNKLDPQKIIDEYNNRYQEGKQEIDQYK